jgi:hypothetical protein
MIAVVNLRKPEAADLSPHRGPSSQAPTSADWLRQICFRQNRDSNPRTCLPALLVDLLQKHHRSSRASLSRRPSPRPSQRDVGYQTGASESCSRPKQEWTGAEVAVRFLVSSYPVVSSLLAWEGAQSSRSISNGDERDISRSRCVIRRAAEAKPNCEGFTAHGHLPDISPGPRSPPPDN